MKNALQEQLIKAGLTKTATGKNHTPNTSPKSAPTAAKLPLNPLAPTPKDIRNQIKKQLKSAQQNLKDGEIKYHFLVGKFVRYLYISKAQHQDIIQGQLVIVAYGERHYLVSPAEASAILAIQPDILVIKHQLDASEPPTEDNQNFKVPDDLMW